MTTAKPLRLEACPACGADHLIAGCPGGSGPDNTLARVRSDPLVLSLDGFAVADHLVSEWTVCGHCALIFARRRPGPDGVERWYPPLFQHSEERGYNTSPLPPAYVAGKKKAAERLFARLEALRVFEGARSLIHYRTGPGHFVDCVQRAHPGLTGYGLEFFEHTEAHARALLGPGRTRRIDVPEPGNPFATRQFDVVVANHFLTHAHDPRKWLGMLKAGLSPGGRLVVYNELDHALSLRSMTAYPRGINFFHKQLFTRATLAGLLQAEGLACEDISGEDAGRRPKYIMLLCRHAEPKPMPKGDAAAALALLGGWRRRHRLYRRLKPVIDPLRRWLK